MSKYKIRITELLEKTMLVQAVDVDVALERVKRMYKDSEIILTAENHTDTDFTVVDEEMEDGRKIDCDCVCACGHTKFTARQLGHHNVIVHDEETFDVDVYASGQPFGPYACVKCGKVYDKLPFSEIQNNKKENKIQEDF